MTGGARVATDVVEAAYRAAPDDRTWLDTVLHAAAPLLDDGLGVIAYHAVRTPEGEVVVEEPVARGARPLTVATFAIATRLAPTEILEQSYFQAPAVTTFSEVVGASALAESPVARALGAASGIHDYLAVRGVDPEGHCVVLGAPLREVRAIDPTTRWRLEQISAHLVAAHRLRRHAARRADGLPADTEAVVSPGKGIVHAEGAAVHEVRSIAEAAERLERARGRLVDSKALDAWTTLVEATWSVVEHFEADGRRYLIARRNAPHARGPSVLSERERQVVCLAVLGHSQKLAAYELGLAPSTVGTLERRAMRKLGVRTRAELVTFLSVLGRRA